MTLDEILDILKSQNPDARQDQIRIYADAAMTYIEATAHVGKYGAVTEHPRTGAPIENPYLKIRNSAAATIRQIELYTGNIWDDPPENGD